MNLPIRDALNSINSAINQEGLVTNNTEITFHVVIQNNDRSFSLTTLPPGQTMGVEAVLLDSNGDGQPDRAARIFNGAGVSTSFNLVVNSNGHLEFQSPHILQGIANDVFHHAGGMMNDKTYLQFLPITEFLQQNPYMENTIQNSFPQLRSEETSLMAPLIAGIELKGLDNISYDAQSANTDIASNISRTLTPENGMVRT